MLEPFFLTLKDATLKYAIREFALLVATLGVSVVVNGLIRKQFVFFIIYHPYRLVLRILVFF